MQPRSPDFIGIGAQNAGTCWLRSNLGRHPGVWMPPMHELHYFDRSLEEGGGFPTSAADERPESGSRLTAALAEFRRLVSQGDLKTAAWSACHSVVDHDDDWYRMLFAFAPRTSMAGEITPRYAICGDAEIEHMHAVAPRAKLLFVLRHPVDRFWSQCLMKHADGSLPPGDAAAMRLFDSANGRPHGDSSKIIVRYCRRFDPAQVHLIFFDGIERQPVRVVREIYAFLGLPEVTIDTREVSQRVNAAADRQPMPESLRSRVTAAYRAEMEILADVFGGYAVSWLGGDEPPPAADPFIGLSQSHVDALQRRHAAPHGRITKRPCRLFCISMQRSGTTSVGDWLESHGLVRVGYPTSARLGWTRLWMQGEHDAIFRSPEFQRAEILEDDPWWCPGYYRVVADRFPEARFILLTRDPAEWFESLCHHSGGYNPGWTDVHARIYSREADLRALVADRTDIDPSQPGLLSIIGHEAHYRAMYERHNAAALAFFAGMPGRLFTGRLEDSQTFVDLCDFAGVTHKPEVAIPRSNARTVEMAQQLAVQRARMHR
jgi:hypothetical protein